MKKEWEVSQSEEGGVSPLVVKLSFFILQPYMALSKVMSLHCDSKRHSLSLHFKCVVS